VAIVATKFDAPIEYCQKSAGVGNGMGVLDCLKFAHGISIDFLMRMRDAPVQSLEELAASEGGEGFRAFTIDDVRVGGIPIGFELVQPTLLSEFFIDCNEYFGLR
jgi:hypothetical protein